MDRKPRLYGLFEKIDNKWVRVPNTGAYPKKSAVQIFQSALLAPYLGSAVNIRCLRPVKEE